MCGKNKRSNYWYNCTEVAFELPPRLLHRKRGFSHLVIGMHAVVSTHRSPGSLLGSGHAPRDPC